MDKRQLSQIKYLNKEIELLRRQIKNMEYSISPNIAIDSVKGSYPAFPYTQHKIIIRGMEYKSNIKRLRRQLSRRLDQLIDMVTKLHEYIATIDDSEIRQIFILRYMDDLTWQQVARYIGGGNTADGVRKTHDRFLAKR